MDLTEALALVEASPDHRVLRRIKLPVGPVVDVEPTDTPKRRGLFIDTETTGLDHLKDEVVEFAAIEFSFDDTGTIHAVGMPFHGYNQPSKPIAPEMTKIHGITDDMVAGKSALLAPEPEVEAEDDDDDDGRSF